jgi:uncharacterized protein with HEPN domain
MLDELRQSAVEWQLFIIGEAVASRLSEEYKASHPSIEWRSIKRMRNILAHGYDFVNLDIIWQTIHDDIPHMLYMLSALEPLEQAQPDIE